MNAIASIFNSPRVGRALFWVGALVLAAGVTVFVIKIAGNDSSSSSENEAALKTPAALNEPTTTKPAKLANVDPAAREVAGKFILTAVARKHLAESWNYVSPTFRSGYTLKQWEKGDIPVTPYPVGGLEQARFKLDYQKPKELQMTVALIPKKGEKGVDATTFSMVLVKRGAGNSAHWLVDYWMPLWSAPVKTAPGGGGQ